MRIEIDPQAANNPASYEWLDRILYRVSEGWHAWEIAGPAAIKAMLGTTWISGRGTQGARVRQVLTASVRRRTWTSAPHGRYVRVTTSPRASDELTPEDAFRLADEPLWILVENRTSDGAFVERIVKELDKSLRHLWSQPGDPIRVDSLGGMGQMQQEVRNRMRGRRYRPRLVVIVDSDRKAPGATASTTAQRLHRTCTQGNLPCWILAKREAENYLPEVLLSARPDTGLDYAQRVAVWSRLTDDQKNFIDVKNGIPATLSAAERSLFGGLSAFDSQILSQGFGSNVHDCWSLWDVPAKQELLARGQGDLECGISLIRREV